MKKIEDHVIQVPSKAGATSHWLYIKTSAEEEVHGLLVRGRLRIQARYLHGPAPIEMFRPFVISMGGSVFSYESDRGTCKITDGTMELPRCLRGHGIGSYLQNITVEWVKSLERNLAVENILLSGIHAETQKDADRRNRFYEQFGVRFNWSQSLRGVDHASGHSDPLLTSNDLTPLSRGVNQLVDAISYRTLEEALIYIGAELAQKQESIKELRSNLKNLEDCNAGLSKARDKYERRALWLGGTAVFLVGAIIVWIRRHFGGT